MSPSAVEPAERVALPENLTDLDPADPDFATQAVDRLLDRARSAGASDLHFQPAPDGLELHWRIDGVLQPLGTLPKSRAANIVTRLKVIAELLTYRTDVPQEGRVRAAPGAIETRVSTFPTLHGERAVVRLFAGPGRFHTLEDLQLPISVATSLKPTLAETSGLIVFAGPAGGGKTTTLYACLRELARAAGGRRSLVTLEDPIESAVPGVVQSQVHPAAGFTLETGLKSLLRQDPEVIAVGEIRDPATAETAFQAALTGHLVLTTFHAGTSGEAVGRLLDMGIEPYLIRSGLRAILAQRLVRRLCSACARSIAEDDADAKLGLPVRQASRASGCAACRDTGYQGRLPLAELFLPDAEMEAVSDAHAHTSARRADPLAATGTDAGLARLWVRALETVEAHQTSPAEVRRVLGLRNPPAHPSDT